MATSSPSGLRLNERLDAEADEATCFCGAALVDGAPDYEKLYAGHSAHCSISLVDLDGQVEDLDGQVEDLAELSGTSSSSATSRTSSSSARSGVPSLHISDALHRKMVDAGIPSSQAWAVIVGASGAVQWLVEHEMLLAFGDEAAPIRAAVDFAISQRGRQ